MSPYGIARPQLGNILLCDKNVLLKGDSDGYKADQLKVILLDDNI